MESTLSVPSPHGYFHYHFLSLRRKLVDRLESLRRLASGNGVTECVLCGDSFGLSVFGRTSYRCADCEKVSKSSYEPTILFRILEHHLRPSLLPVCLFRLLTTSVSRSDGCISLFFYPRKEHPSEWFSPLYFMRFISQERKRGSGIMFQGLFASFSRVFPTSFLTALISSIEAQCTFIKCKSNSCY